MLVKKFSLWLSPFIILIMATICAAQSTDGAITGKVSDDTNAIIAGATVTVESLATSLKFNTTSDEQGIFHFDHLPVGKYSVLVESVGFNKTTAEIVVPLNQVVDVNVKLKPGEVTDVVTVSAGGEALVETTTSTLSNNFDARRVVDLPGSNGSQLELALLAPNVTSQSGGTAGEGGSVGGNRPRNNSFTLDGVDNNDAILTGHVIDVIPEAVSEFSVLTNQYSAEFGHSSAGQFNTITKSGSNELHGGLSFINNNKNYNAVDHLTKEAIANGAQADKKPRFDFNRLSAFIGGPIIKNRLFFFGAYQYKNSGTAGTSTSFVSPTNDGFGLLGSLNGVSPFTLNLLRQFSIPAAVADQGSITVLGRQIPVGTVNVLIPSFSSRQTFNVNIDQIYGNNDQLRYRYNYDRLTTPNVGNGNPIFTGNLMSLNQLTSFGYIHSFSPTLLNEFRFSYRRQNQIFGIPDQFKAFPNIEVDETNLALGPQTDSPQGGISNSYQYIDNLTFIRGKHNFKTGVEFRVNISPQSFLPRGRGEYDYGTLEEFLKDVKPTGGNGGLRGVGDAVFAANQTAFYTFFQDDFHVTPNLTFNLGLRYEYTSIFRDEKLQARNALSSVPGVIEFRAPESDKNNFAPRIGFAWSPNFSNKVGKFLFGNPGQGSLRGGFGISYDVLFGNLATLQLPPQFQQELDASAGNGGPFGTNTAFLQNGGITNTPIPPNTTADARAATGAFIPDHVSPYSMSYTLDYQREFAKNWSVDLRYLGTRGVKLITQVRLNDAMPPFAQFGGQSLPTYLNASQVPSQRVLDSMLTLDDLNNAAIPSLGQFGFLSNVTAFLPIGSSTYHSGSVQVTRRFTQGLTLTSNYTYSHTIDYGTNDLFTSLINPRRAQNGFNIGDMKGNSALDRTHRFVAYGIYELPFGRQSASRLVRTLLGGFQISAVYTAESGQPFTALSGTDSNLNGDSAGDRTIFNASGIKNTGSGVNPVLNSRGQVVGYLAENGNAQYIQAGQGTIATAGANTLRTPGINNWDISLFKIFKLNERVNLEFRTEMFNAFNHEQLIVGNGSVVDPNQLGVAQATNSAFANVNSPSFNNPRVFVGRPRVINFGLKLSF